MLTDQEQTNLKEAAKAAVATQKTYGLPAQLTLAQWAEESGWGVHSPGNNCFGIKSYYGCPGIQVLPTREFVHHKSETLNQAFALFPDLTACFTKHATLLTQSPRYLRYWREYKQTPDPDQLVRAFAPVYSSSPAYADTIIHLMRDQRIIDAIQEANT